MLQPSNEMVEWDLTHATVLKIRHDQYSDPYIVPGTRARADSRTKWMRVVVDYPDDYLPGFEELLGPANYEPLDDQVTLRRYYRQADFSVERVRDAVLDRLDWHQFELLFQTDFYVTRLAETGEPIPEDIAAKRIELRDTVKRLKAKARKSSPAELASFQEDEIDHLPKPERPTRIGPYDTSDVEGAYQGHSMPGDRPSSLRPGEEPTPFDESLTVPPDPALEGAPAPWVTPPVPPGDGN